MANRPIRRFDGIYRSGIKMIVDTWKTSPFRVPILLITALSTLTSSVLLLYQNPEPTQATVTSSGNMYYGDTTNAGKIKMLPFTNPGTYGTELNVNLGPTVNIMHVAAKTAPTREEKMIGFVSGNPTTAGRLDIVTGTTGFESAADYTLRWTATTVSGTQDCDAVPTLNTCTQPFDLGYESLSGRGLVVYAGDSDANSTTDTDKVYYAFWDGSAWSPDSTPNTPSATNELNLPGTAGTPKWVRVIAAGDNLADDRSNRAVVLVADSNNDLFAYYWDGSAFDSGSTLIATLGNCDRARCFDGNWQGNSTFVVNYTNSGVNEVRYQTYLVGTGWSGDTQAYTTSAAPAFIVSAADPTSSRIIVANYTTGADSRSAVWRADNATDGWTVCASGGCPDTSLEAIGGPQVGVAFERFNGEALHVINDAANGTIQGNKYMTYTPTSTWGSSTVTGITPSDDHQFTKVVQSPNSDDIMIMAADVDCDVDAVMWNGSGLGTVGSNFELLLSSSNGGCVNTVPIAGMMTTGGMDFAWNVYSPWGLNWRFTSDTTNATPGSWLANENVAPSAVADGTTVRLRYGFVNRGTTSQVLSSEGRKYLQYTTNDPDSLTATWTDVDAQAGGGAWRYANCSSGTDDSAIPSAQLTAPSGGSNQVGDFIENSGNITQTHNAGPAVALENDYCIQANGPSGGTTYYFRAYDNEQKTPVYREQDNDGANDCASATCVYPSLTTSSDTITGTFFPAGETGNEPGQCDGATANLSLRVDGGTAVTTVCTDTTGAFSFTGFTASAGQTVAIYSTGTNKANTIYISNGSSNTGMHLYENRVALGHKNAGPIDINDLDAYDSDQNDTDMLFDAEDAATDTLIVESGNELHIRSSETFTPGGDITTPKMHVVGTYTGASETLTISGTGTGTSRPLYVDGGTFTPSTNTTTFTGTSAVDIGAITFNNLNISPASGTQTYTLLAGTLAINGNLAVNNGATLTVDVSTNNPAINLAGNLTLNTGTTWTASTSAAFTFKPTGTKTWTDNVTTKQNLGLVTIGSGASTPRINLGSAVRVTRMTIDSSHQIDVNGSNKITFTGTSGTLLTNSGTFTQSTGEVEITSASGTPTFLSGTTTFHKLTINAAATVINIGSDTVINNASGADLTITSGVFNVGGGTLTGPGSGNGTLTIASGATLCLGGTTGSTNSTCNSGATQTTARSMPVFQTYSFNSASTVRYLSNFAQTVDSTPQYGNLELKPLLTAARIYTFGGATTINGNFEINPDAASALLLTVEMAGHITVASSKTTTITRTGSNATSTLDTRPAATDYNLTTGSLSVASGGTLDATAAASAIGVAGNYTNNGTFTAGSSIVTLNGSSTQTLSGTMTGGSAFYDLVISNNSGTSASTCERDSFVASVDFSADATATNNYTITTANVRVEYDDGNTYTFNNISWNGQASGTRIYFRSSAVSGTWLLNVSGTQAVSYVNVSRSDATPGSIIDASNGTSFDCGNNTDWDFGTITISGTCDQYDQTTDCTESDGTAEFAVAVNSTLQGQVDITIDGSWSISGVTKPSSGDIITVFVNSPNAPSNSAVAVTKYDGTSDITGVILYERHLTIGSADNQTLSNADIDAYDNSVSADADIFFEVDASNDLVVDTAASFTDEELYIVSGNTYQPDSGNSGNVSTHDIEIDGSFSPDSNSITINGSWDNDGDYNSGAETVTFTSTSSESLDSTGASDAEIYNITLNGSGGSWLLGSALTVVNNVSVTNGTLDSNNTSNYAVNVGNNFTGNSGTWTLQMRASTWTVSGNWDTSAVAADSTNIVEATSTLVLDGTGTKTLKTGATNVFTARFYNLSVGQAAGKTTQLLQAVAYSNIFTLGAGSFDLNTFDLYVASTNANPLSINASGTFGSGNGRIITSGSTTHNFPGHTYNTKLFEAHNTGFKTVLTGTTSFASIDIGCCSRASELDTNGQTLTVVGDMYLASSIAILTAGNSTINVGGNWLNTGTGVFNAGTSTVNMTSSSAVNFYSGGTGSGKDFNNLIHSGSGQIILNTYNVGVTNDLTNSGGSMTGSVSVTVNGSVTGVGAITLSGSSTFEQRVAADETFGTSSGSNNWTFINLILSNSSGVDRTITPNAGTGSVIASTLLQVGRGTDTNKTIFDNNTSNDRIIDVNDDITISSKGTLLASNNQSFTVADDWTLTSGGTFTHNNGTVIFDTTSTARLAGPTTFYNFTSTTGAKTLEFTSGETFTIDTGGLFTITGGVASQIHIHSSDGATRWFINHQGTESVTNTHISNSGCDGSSTNVTTTTSVDDGNNGTCWLFGSTYDQSAYRFANNENGTTVNYTDSPAQDSALTVSSTGQAFRLRMLLTVGGSNLAQNGETFKLQYGEKTAANCTTGVSWGDMATGSGVIRYKNNASPADGDNLTTNAGDPFSDGATVDQDYEEANNFTNSVAAINSGDNGQWDFSLENNSSVGGKRYCFKAVKSAGSDLESYSIYPEVLVDEELVFSIDSSSINFGVIQPGANPIDGDNTLTTTTNAQGGFVIYAWTTQAMTKGTHTLPDWTGTNATPTTFGNGSFGFGYTTDDTNLTGGGANRFSSGTLFAGFTHSGPGDPVADQTSGPVSTSNKITYRIAGSTGQQAGTYSSVVVYIVVPTF